MLNRPKSLTLLPYEFARLNRVLVRPDSAELIHTQALENWVLSELIRCNDANLSLKEVDNEEFDQLLARLYQNQQSSSETVMA